MSDIINSLKKIRLDHAMVQAGLVESRSRAQIIIKAGGVCVDGKIVRKTAMMVEEVALIEIVGEVCPYVSRGGLKLARALEHFNIEVKDKICLDLGASTGGFCDVLLRAGAAKIYAVDVGQRQLHPKILVNPLVVNLEKTHAKDITRDLVPETIDLFVCDVSFISLKKALSSLICQSCDDPHIASSTSLIKSDGVIVALIKPQFEVGRERIGRGGIVKSGPDEIAALLEDIATWFQGNGFATMPIIDSPILGGDGNKEYLICAQKTAKQ